MPQADLEQIKKRVLFFIPTLEAGGAERVCINYVNNLRSHRPILLLQLKRGPLLRIVSTSVPLLEIFALSIVENKASRLVRSLRVLGKGIQAVRAFFISVTEPPQRAFRSFLWQIKALLSRAKQRFSQVILTTTYFVASVPLRLIGTLLRWLRKIKPAYYCYSLLWQARRLAAVARESGCGVVVSSITLSNIIAILAKLFFDRHLKVVVNVHDVTSRILQHSKLERYERFLLRWLVRLLYPRADVIVAVAQGIKRDLIENFGLPAEKIVVIYNPIDVQNVCVQAAEPVLHPWFDERREPLLIAVGRLVKLKGFDILIRAVAQLSMKVNLVIIGEGEERSALENLIVELGLTDRVALLGFQENPWKYMARADLFVLSSLTEGLPNVIGEAMALGLPVLATDCSPSVREYLDEGRAGLLVPSGDPKALAHGIEQLLLDRQLRQELAHRGRERIAQFDLSVAVQTYESLLESLLD